MGIRSMKTLSGWAFMLAFAIPTQADCDELSTTYLNHATNEGRVEKLVFNKQKNTVIVWLAGFPGPAKPDDPNYPTAFSLGETNVDWYYEWNVRGKNLIGIASFPKARYKPFVVLRQGGTSDDKRVQYFTYTCCMDYGVNKTYTEGRLDFEREEMMKDPKLQRSEKVPTRVSPYSGGYGSGPTSSGGRGYMGDFWATQKRFRPQDKAK